MIIRHSLVLLLTALLCHSAAWAQNPDAEAAGEDLAPAPTSPVEQEPLADEPIDGEDEEAEDAEPAEPQPVTLPAQPDDDRPSHETNCYNGLDDDGDTLIDCADADCYEDPACQPDGLPENTNSRCSDWIDNDQDGFIDCDDESCHGPNVTVCRGSWQGDLEGRGLVTSPDEPATIIPELADGMVVEDLFGRFGDIDGERDNMVCSDGIDNDGDGRVDCEDFGCRFDPTVSVCHGSPNLRFSVVTMVTQSYDLSPDLEDSAGSLVPMGDMNRADTRFSALQLRAFGPIPYIDDSFFLISSRFEKTPRLTFAMASLPIRNGHFLNINSGGGGLSNALILSASKQLLLEAPYYVYNAFEQGNGAAIEFSGPLVQGLLDYRVFLAGGSGRFTGSIGGRYFTYNNTNYTWAAGGQLILSPVGNWSRWGSPFLYVPAPLTVGITLGAKYDQRAQERYPAMNLAGGFRWWRLVGQFEFYGKRELEFGSWQGAYNVQLGFLLVPKLLLLGADFGQYLTSAWDNPPATLETDLRRQRNETQWRMALHWYFYRSIGVMSLLYKDRFVAQGYRPSDTPLTEREVSLVAQFRF